MLTLIKHVLFLYTIMKFANCLICNRIPSNTLMPKSPVDENFAISITGNPSTYQLGQEYNISLNAFNGLRYISFKLALEDEDGNINYELGQFKIVDSVHTRHNPHCINMVESTNTSPKTRIHVSWIAPTNPGVGCVLIRATILQHRDIWYMDDGGLTKRICEEEVDDGETHKKFGSRRHCCACDEARYDLIFEGIWSRNLHPKDFPSRGWNTGFSDIIGASHIVDYRYWEYNAYASKAMQNFAEHGSSQLLEEDFNNNFKMGNIRTIIKTRGLKFPNINKQSLAEVRVDPQHHLISLVSKIEPSPDWIVGVSGLDLCMINCTWMDYKVINLYPWDIGTDAGSSYMAADQPQVPPDVIRRMRSDFPNDPRSPFYSENGMPMKPFATLTVRKKRIYERMCLDEESNNNNVARECMTHPWSPWTKCSAKCGEGWQSRKRVFKQPEVAKIYNCDSVVVTRQEQPCQGTSCTTYQYIDPNTSNKMQEFEYQPQKIDDCQLSDWSPWSPCNTTCGEGVTQRSRQYINERSHNRCKDLRRDVLIETNQCFGWMCSGDNDQPNLYSAPSYDNDQMNSFPEKKLEEYKLISPLERQDYQEPPPSEQYQYYNYEKGDNFQWNSRDIVKTFEEETYPNIKQNVYQSEETPFTYPVPAYCFEPLELFTCLETRITGNFWFYNYCEDKCMIYTADSCDRNANKFSSLETCELRCRSSKNEIFLRKKQLRDCKYTKVNRNTK